jgi:hypothetical protein
MLSIKHNFVFIHIPKTGGNSFQSVIEPFTEDSRRKTSPNQDLENRFSVSGPITTRKHCTSAEYIERLGLERFMKLKRVSFVRHPLSRAMSRYFSPSRWLRRAAGRDLPPASFDKLEFARLLGKMPTATSYLQYNAKLLDFDFLGRYESFDEDFRKMLDVCGLPPLQGELPHRNRGNGDKMSYCDPEVIAMVKERFIEDFINFGYHSTGVIPSSGRVWPDV